VRGALARAWRRLGAFLFSGPRLDRDLDAEMAAHLDLATDDNIRAGLSPEEARRQALIRFGGVEQAREHHRETRSLPFLEVLGQDLRYALRALRRDRGFATVAIVILGLGIGANVAVFSVVDTILVRPLPFRDPARLVWITGPPNDGGLSRITYSADAYDQLRARSHAYEDVAAYVPFFGSSDYKLTGRGEPRPVSGVIVTANFFPLLGLVPALGRPFTPDESRAGGGRAVLLSHPFWERQFGGDPGIVGQPIVLNGQPYTVAGVMPSTFDFGAVFAPGTRIDIFVAAVTDEIREWGNTLIFLGRLAPGVGVAQAQAEADLLFPHFDFNARHPGWGNGYQARVVVLKDHVTGALRRALLVLWSAVGLILLIVCVNLSNLLLARTAARSRELALRSALGAGRGRLVRQLLTESLVLAGAGAVLGLVFARAVTAYLARQGSIALPLLSSLGLDRAALGWTLLTALVSAALFGLVPGLRTSGPNLQDALKDSGPGMSEGRRHDRLRASLVVSEIALACVLLVGAGLLLRSFLRVLDVDLGFQPDRAAALKLDFENGAEGARRGAVLQEVLARVRALPGVQAAGITDMLPLDRNRSWGFAAKGQHYAREDYPTALLQVVTPGYLEVMGMRLREGRDLTWADSAESEKVVLVNEAAARRLWPGQDPLGRIALVNASEARVVGLVADVRATSVEDRSGPQIYLPMTQARPVGAELVVRTSLPPGALAPAVLATLRAIDPAQPAAELRPIRDIVDHAVSPRRFFALLVSAFAVLGLTLASLGVYGVISYSVERRRQEIGIRLALGATSGRVQRDVMARTLKLALVGIVLGAAASFALARGMAALLYDTAPRDPFTLAGTALLLGTVALVAGYLPARRASRISPMIALRND